MSITGQYINELENGQSSYRQKSNYFARVLMKPYFFTITTWIIDNLVAGL